MAKDGQFVWVDGRKLRVTNLDKVLYPSTGTTKGEVLAYYSAIAETMLPHCVDRPATRKRWPDGVGEDGKQNSFFQKDIGEGAPEWVATGEIQHKDHVNEYPLVNDEATLVWLAQLASLEIHVPQWRFDSAGKQQNPDRMVFDLDPGEGVKLTEVADVAFLVRDILSDMGLPSIPLTSGSSGIHLYAALDGTLSSDEVAKVAKELARSLEADHPDDITSSMKRSLRPGKVFIDWSQNNAAKTTVAPYSLRGRIAPTVAAPRTWRELASPHLKHLRFDEVLKRVERRGDPLAELLRDDAGERGLAERGAEKLNEYRAKRDASKTSEPVPRAGRRDVEDSRAADAGSGSDAEGDSIGFASGAAANTDARSSLPRFVIQRHQARRLHYDFRLEHDGVLVSWAIPKGPPTDPKVNHLAVPTEDHPMSYRHFEGVIPKGEYGAGKVEIWDSGHYELEKWRDDEVIVTLHGAPGGGLSGGLGESGHCSGSKRFALFRAGESGGKPRWMIHLMSPANATHATSAESATSATSVERAQPVSSMRAPLTKQTSPSTPTQSRTPTLSPMLALAGSEAEFSRLDLDEWGFEMKWDGIRALVEIAHDRTLIRSRSGADISESYPEFFGLAEYVNAEAAVLDGEIVTLGPDGAPSFSLLQQRFGLTNERDIARARRAAPASLLVFDVLEVNGQDCTRLPYRQRRELLQGLVEVSAGSEATGGAPVAVPDHFDGTAQDAADASAELGLEGVVAKRWNSAYHPGERSGDWMKFPIMHTDEAVVIGWRESTSDAKGFASLLLADRTETGDLSYAGRVGTGFSSAERRRIRTLLEPLQTSKPVVDVPAEAQRDAQWVRPKLIGEVISKGRTRTGSFRQPVWRGWRPDKTLASMN
ncbi:ATP-dependent DNA ligase [Leucobacter denitrificans]|uniref:DNA ligase (ATP) n=1 Tax=Leucobacter denitrificans TaxID=683042 RepID=A0A7G9S6A0_9MICO|nr:ATP-dependent DNA ligase [Leucobacter denitrificans]QNN63375.1 ATP-dependent DNA ligase [Leucobacter denitrificans]